MLWHPALHILYFDMRQRLAHLMHLLFTYLRSYTLSAYFFLLKFLWRIQWSENTICRDSKKDLVIKKHVFSCIHSSILVEFHRWTEIQWNRETEKQRKSDTEKQREGVYGFPCLCVDLYHVWICMDMVTYRHVKNMVM